MNRIKLLILLLFVSSISVYSQQESQYTQYMYNTLSINPAYAGSSDVGTFFGIHRSQWIGIDGAPRTSNISFHTPFRTSNLGVGVSLYHESIGPLTTSNITGDISYALDFENNSKLAFGIKGTLGFFSVDYSKLNIKDANDSRFMINDDYAFSPNVGVGAYWYSDKYYLGLSVPYLLQTDIYQNEDTKLSFVKNTQHYHIIGGYVFDLSENIKFKPAFLTKIVEGSPLQFDLSANFMFNERFVLGGAWRWSAAVSAMAGFQINNNWFIGYGYDFETTELSKYNSGSHEIFLRYQLYHSKKKIISPRFF